MSDKRIKYRLKFSKTGRLRFIGHLDLLNLFHRALKRAGLPVSYSLGFNPHMETAFALPLSLGYAGNGEYIDIMFSLNLDGSEIKDKLNKAMPGGLVILSARPLIEGEKSAASTVAAAEYTVQFPAHIQIPVDKATAFINQNSIMTMKKTKKKIQEADIKPDIIKYEPINENGYVTELNVLLSAGANRSIRVDSVVKALCQIADMEYDPYGITFIRQNLYRLEDGNYISLE